MLQLSIRWVKRLNSLQTGNRRQSGYSVSIGISLAVVMLFPPKKEVVEYPADHIEYCEIRNHHKK